jgi:outer membrane protein TolC
MFTALSHAARRARRLPGRRARVVALCIAFAGGHAPAQQALTLDQALRLAQERSRQLVAQDAAASASRELAQAAGQLPDPVLKAGVTNLPVDGPDRFSLTRDFMTMRSVGVMQEFTRADKRSARTARFAREADTAQAGRALALARLRRDTALAWLDRHYQERMLGVLQEQRAEAALQIEAADAAYRGARGSQADVFAARSADAQIVDRIRQTERQVATAKTRLARWVGSDAEQALAAAPALDAPGLQDHDLESQLQHHPELTLMARQEDMARADADIAQSNKQSDWSLELMYSQRGPAYSNMVSINVAIPLQIDPRERQDRDVAARLAMAEQMRAQREETAREHLAETRSWLQEWQSNRDRLAHYDQVLIPLAIERTRATLAAYRGGSGPLAAVLEARRMEIDVRLDKLRLETETAGVWARLEYLIPPQPPEADADRAANTKGKAQ